MLLRTSIARATRAGSALSPWRGAFTVSPSPSALNERFAARWRSGCGEVGILKWTHLPKKHFSSRGREAGGWNVSRGCTIEICLF